MFKCTSVHLNECSTSPLKIMQIFTEMWNSPKKMAVFMCTWIHQALISHVEEQKTNPVNGCSFTWPSGGKYKWTSAVSNPSLANLRFISWLFKLAMCWILKKMEMTCIHVHVTHTHTHIYNRNLSKVKMD